MNRQFEEEKKKKKTEGRFDEMNDRLSRMEKGMNRIFHEVEKMAICSCVNCCFNKQKTPHQNLEPQLEISAAITKTRPRPQNQQPINQSISSVKILKNTKHPKTFKWTLILRPKI